MIPLKINTDFESLKERHVKLSNFSKENYGFSITGDIDLIDQFGKNWETYTIKIAIPDTYPEMLPSIFEISNKIPKHRHVNGDGSCCLSPLVEQAIILGKDYNLVDYIDKLVIPYLAGQKLVDLGIDYPNGEYSHNEIGLIEYYKIKFQTRKLGVVLNCLRNFTGAQRNRPNSKCFCKSRLKYIECHKPMLKQFSEVNTLLIKNNLKSIEYYLKKKHEKKR